MKVFLPFLFLSFVSSIYLRSGHRDHLFTDDGITFQEKNETLTDDYVLTLPREENETLTDDYVLTLPREKNEKYCKSISLYVYDKITETEVNDYDITIVFDP